MNRLERFWEGFSADLARQWIYQPALGRLGRLKLAFTLDGLWALAAYRLGRRLRSFRVPVLGALSRFGFRLFQLAVRIFTGIHLDEDAEIGPGFYIGHFGSIYVGPGVQIGRNSSIGQLCLVAAAGPGGGAPVVGERVYLGAGCKVLGPVRIEDGAAIGANAVVMEDLPRDAVAVGVPARVVSHRGSSDFIYLGT